MLTAAAVAAAVLFWAPAAGARQAADLPPVARAQPLVGVGGIAAAVRYAATRRGHVAFAVLDGSGRLRGWHRTDVFPSASVSKAMMLVGILRRVGDHSLDPAWEAGLRRMITESDNDDADRVYRELGGAGLTAVARAAGMRRFHDTGHWAGAHITAADQTRLFLRIDRLVGLRHRAFARDLLSSIVPWQRWGLATVADARGYTVLFKAGWRRGLEHQAALLERDGRRVAVAVLTTGDPSPAYGRETEAGIARRLLR